MLRVRYGGKKEKNTIHNTHLQYREFRDGDIEEEIREAFQVVCYRNDGGVDDNCSVFLLKVFDRDGHGWINTPELQEVRMAMKFPKSRSPLYFPHE